MDKHIPKKGAGPHNWGRLEDEYEHENAALDDEQADFEDATGACTLPFSPNPGSFPIPAFSFPHGSCAFQESDMACSRDWPWQA